MISYVIAARLPKETVVKLDKVRGRYKRGTAIKDLLTAALEMRHEYTWAGMADESCRVCGQFPESTIHLTFPELDRAEYGNLMLHEAARSDPHEEG